MNPIPYAFFSSLLLLTMATAQTPVTVRGEINDGTGGGAGCFWCTGAPFVLKWSGTTVQSATVNLATFLGQDVVIQGTWNGSVLTANTVAAATQAFSMGGNPSLGQQMRFTTSAPPGTLAANFGALGSQLSVPFGNFGLLLAPASAVAFGAGFTNAGGDFRTQVLVPNVPALVGVRVFGQGVIVPDTAPLFATEVDAVQIQ